MRDDELHPFVLLEDALVGQAQDRKRAVHEEAVEGAEIVIGGSGVNGPNRPPVMLGKWLRPGMHVGSIAGRAELDDEVVGRADRVVVDAKKTFSEESWDITRQVEKGIRTWDEIDALEDIVGGPSAGPSEPRRDHTPEDSRDSRSRYAARLPPLPGCEGSRSWQGPR